MRTAFRHPIRCVEKKAERRKDKGAQGPTVGSFQWTSGVQAMCLFFVQWAHWARSSSEKDPKPLPTFQGKKNTLAASLDMALSKDMDIQWVGGIFGCDEDGKSLLRDCVRRTNPGLKRKGEPVTFVLQINAIPPANIRVFVGESEATSATELEKLSRYLRSDRTKGDDWESDSDGNGEPLGRGGSPPDRGQSPHSIAVELIIDRDLASFSDEDLDQVILAIKKRLKTQSVRVVVIRRGSVKVVVEVPGDKIAELVQAVAQGALDQFDVVSAEPLSPSGEGTASLLHCYVGALADQRPSGEGQFAEPRVADTADPSTTKAEILGVPVDNVKKRWTKAQPALDVDDDRLIDLLDEWEERVARAEVVSAAELCKDRPDLVPALTERIARLNRVAPMAEPNPLDQATEPWQRPVEPLADRYRLDEVIGEGGFGEVWRGYDLELERPVAVKLPRPDRLPRGPGGEGAFRAEARRVAGLSHPGIVQVFDVGQYRGRTFIVSALIDGEDLARRIRRGRVPLREAVRIVAEAAAHLHYAHEQGFVHRDIKPANILLGTDGRVFVTDFGVAVSAEDLKAGAADRAGTRAYMAPEQLAPEPGKVDRRADVFALGVVLIELLTGRNPFGSSVRPLEGTADASTARELPRKIPPKLRKICKRCLEHRPADRYESTQDLADDLLEWSRSRRSVRPFLIAVSLMGLGLILVGIVARPDHSNVAFYVGRGAGLSDMKEYDKAIRDFDEAIRLDPKNAPAFILRGRAWYSKNEYDKAIGDFDEAIRLDPNSANAFVWRGRAWYRKKEYDRAIQDYEKAVRLDPNNVDAFFRRGLAWYRKKEYDQAIGDFDQAIHLRPDDAYAAIMCYFAARRTGNERVAERALQASADSPSAPWPNPAVRFLRGQIDEAGLLMLADDDEKRTEAHYYLGLDQAIKDRKKEAIAHFRWVKDRGSSAVSAHALALEELERLEPDEK